MSCFACAIVRGFFTAEGRTALRARSVVASFLRMAELLRLRDRSWVCYCGWPRFGCAILDDCVWIRGLGSKSAGPRFAQQILGSDVCVRDPRIIAQSSNPRFAQQNPRMVRIRTLRLTYTWCLHAIFSNTQLSSSADSYSNHLT